MTHVTKFNLLINKLRNAEYTSHDCDGSVVYELKDAGLLDKAADAIEQIQNVVNELFDAIDNL